MKFDSSRFEHTHIHTQTHEVEILIQLCLHRLKASASFPLRNKKKHPEAYFENETQRSGERNCWIHSNVRRKCEIS